MTLEQGWLHALILAHLVQQSRGYSPENAAHWALVRVRRQEIAHALDSAVCAALVAA